MAVPEGRDRENVPPVSAPAPVIPSLDDYTRWAAKAPSGPWTIGATVTYTVTHANTNGVKVSEPTTFVVSGLACPTIILPIDVFGTTDNRRIRRRIERDGRVIHEGDIALIDDNTTTTYSDVDGFEAPSAQTVRHAVVTFDRASGGKRGQLPEALPRGSSFGLWRPVLDVQLVRPGAWHVRVGTYAQMPPPLPPYVGKGHLAGPSDVVTYLYWAGEVSVVDGA